MLTELWNVITSWNFITVAVAAVGAYFAARAVHETRQAAQAQLASALLDAYASGYVVEDIEALKGWWQANHPGGPVNDFIAERAAGVGDAPRVDRARRHIAHYFQKAVILLKKDFIDRDLLRYVISDTQVKFATEHVEPLDIAIGQRITGNPDPSWAYRELRALHGIEPEPYPAPVQPYGF